MPTPLPDPNALAAQAAEGDAAAFRDLILATQGEVWRFIAHLTDANTADDLTQDTFIRAWSSIRRFEGRSSARTWLLSIARRAVADELRRRYRRPSTAPISDAVESSLGVGGGERLLEVQELLAGLDEDRRVALVLTQVIGLSYEEAAKVCKVPVGTIRSRVARGRQDLISLEEA